MHVCMGERLTYANRTGFAAVKTAMKLGPGHRIVTVLSDSGSRHLSRFWAKAGDVGSATETRLEDVLNA